ncbi:hypothetical protein [Burkholderia gladioli]|uniref:hypothetical protein n=1 Tax=Burkholderia gladioli TaxID=28095 RepID=UPI00164126EB|nr:hypothetical protein [Burkholderia gladioli]
MATNDTAAQQPANSAASPARPAKSPKVLKSDWSGLNDALQCKIFPMKRDTAGKGWVQSVDKHTVVDSDSFTVDDGYEVWGPITDANFELSANWHSPFENAGTESKAPTLSAMLQSGALSDNLTAFFHEGGGADVVNRTAAVAQGRVGITKLNSTQVFQGMPPGKLTLTMHFRALVDPKAEVQQPISQLEQWVVPQWLAADSVLANAAQNGTKQNIMETIFPSVTPQIVGVRYANRVLQPMVIEALSEPFTTPLDSSGASISCAVQLTLATLSAWDRRDIMASYR